MCHWIDCIDAQLTRWSITLRRLNLWNCVDFCFCFRFVCLTAQKRNRLVFKGFAEAETKETKNIWWETKVVFLLIVAGNQKYLSIHALDQCVQLVCNMKLVRHSGTRDWSSPSSSNLRCVWVCVSVYILGIFHNFFFFTMFNVSNLMVNRTIIDFTIGILYNVIGFYNWNFW